MKKLLAALLPVALVFGCVGCKRESGTIDGASKEQAEEMIGQVDAPEYDQLDEFLDSHLKQDSKDDEDHGETNQTTTSSFSFHISF